MNDIINIKEKFKVDDSHSKIRGFVCAYDENGRLVFSKENMIVESGRRFILNNGINENSLKYVQLGTSGNPASPDDTIASLNESVSDSIVKTDVDFKFSEDYFKTNFENLDIGSENNICLKNSKGTKTPQYFEYSYDRESFIGSENNAGYSFKSPSTSKGEKAIIVFYEDDSYGKRKYHLRDNKLSLIQDIILPEENETYGDYKFEKKEGDISCFLYNGANKIENDVSDVSINGKTFKWINNDKKFIETAREVSVTNGTTITYNCITEDNHFSYFIDSNNLVINCFICFNGKESIAAKSLGIIAHYPETSTAVDSEGNSLANQDVLFSRVTFPTYYKSNHQRLTFRYYIYF